VRFYRLAFPLSLMLISGPLFGYGIETSAVHATAVSKEDRTDNVVKGKETFNPVIQESA